jgi:anti-sigma factor RsiW
VTAAEYPIGEDDLHAYVDGQVTMQRRTAIEAYLASHPTAEADVAADLEVMSLLCARLSPKAEEPVPQRLRVSSILAARRYRTRRHLFSIAAAVGWLAIGVAGGWIANSAVRGSLFEGQSAVPVSSSREAIAAYRTFVVEKLHPVEVRADQEAHLVQWLSRRLGHPLSAPDLSTEGYELMGGRLLPSGNDPAAMFMYADRAGARLTLYARPEGPSGGTGFQYSRQDGVSAFAWVDRDLSYVVTAATDKPHLLAIAESVYRQLAPPAEARP